MRVGEHLDPDLVREVDAGRVLGLAGVSRDPHFRHRRMRLADNVQILRRISLPLLRDDLVVAFDEHFFGAVAAAGGVVAHHRLVDDDRLLRTGDDLFLFLRLLRILAHTISASPRSTLPVATTVRTIASYAAHLQMCPASAAFTWSTDGFGFLSSSAF